MFVHDFVTIPLPMASALSAVSQVLQHQSELLVRQAWAADTAVWTAAGLSPEDLDPGADFHVEVGPPRVRLDAAVLDFCWTVTGARLIPSLDADLELAARGTELSDLQLLGRYRFEAGPPRTPDETSLAHRAVVSAVRRFLTSVADASMMGPGFDTEAGRGHRVGP